MKISLFCIVLLVVSMSMAWSNTLAQNIYTKKIEMGMRSTSLKTALTQLEKKTGISIFYPSELVEQYVVNPLPVASRTIAETLAGLLEGTNLTYSQNGENIVLFEKKRTKSESIDDQQPEKRSGIIKDERGQPIAGVSIIMKNYKEIAKKTGLQTSTATDGKGHWSLIVPSDTITLIFSGIGYEKQEIRVGHRNSFDITLKSSTQELESVVVTGLFERPREVYTGAALSFNQEQLQQVSANNILTALKSLDPSFQMPDNINLGSNPNALPEVTLRGGNSLIDPNTVNASNPFNYANAPNTPLFILDGFEVSLSRINDLDLSRVKRVDILKDATATSIYGSRAANGVLVIETIRPKSGKLNLTYTANMNIETPDLSTYHLLNAQEKLDLENRLGFYHNAINYKDQELQTIYNARLAAIREGVNTDWLAQPVRTGVGQKHNLYLEGGREEVQYGVNLTYYNNVGVMKGSNRGTMTGNTFLSYRYKDLIFKNDLTLVSNKANNSPYGSFRRFAQANPYWTPYNADGSYKVYMENILNEDGIRLLDFDGYNNLNGYTGRAVNPLYDASLNLIDQTKYHSIINNFSIEYKANSWLRFRGTLAYLYQADEGDRFLPAQHSSFAGTATFEKGSYDKSYGRNQRFEGILTANMNKSIGKHLLLGTIGVNMSNENSSSESFKVVGFPNATTNKMTQGLWFALGSKPVGTENIKRLASLLSSFSYSYDNRYLTDLSFRVDGSSQFGADKRYAPFWSAGAGWNVHNESFLKDNPSVNNLRLRYSFGYTGSQNFESFYGNTTSQYYNYAEYRGMVGTYLLGFGNRNLAWQKTQKNNIGVDVVLFNRLNLSANYYVEKTQGSIASISTAPSTGFGSYKENMGDLVAKGWEAYLNYKIIKSTTNRNQWSVFVNMFSVKNRIDKISNTIAALNKAADETSSTAPITRFSEGQSTTAIWAVRSLGIDPATGYEIFLKRDGSVTTVYNPRDQVIVGDSRSKVEGTFGTNFEFKGIGFNAYLRFRIGGQAYNQSLADRVENINVAMYNADKRVAEERWMKQGDLTYFKGIVDVDGFSIDKPTYATSRFVQNNSFINLESISIYYRFSDKLNQRLGIRNTKITALTNDVTYISTIKRERGLDYPFGRTFTLQLSTSF